ncbi:MAG: SGNH/GDSL hydrolase family protein, partial [Clostridia bacterium]|nr:SGNH/GDSL hydrolase family protein [Clostridia bacterium]
TMEGRTIRATENTSMPWLEEKVLFGIDMPEGKGLSTQPVSEAGAAKGYESVLYTESAFLIENQVLVTYDYDRREFDSKVIPAYQGEKLPNTLQKLQNKETVDIIAFGDSISTGCNSTGGGLQSIYDDTYPGNSLYIPFDRAPYTPTFPEMFAEGLAEKYGSDVGVYGAAMGGQTSDWGARSAAARVVNPDMGYDPDLVTITFGMNDATLGVPLDRFEENLLKIIDDIRAVSGKTVEFILIGTMLANSNASQCKNQEAYWPVMQKVAALREGVAAVDMGGMHKFFLQNKKPADMLANNINHPNDFLIRMYAMNLLATLIQE